MYNEWETESRRGGAEMPMFCPTWQWGTRCPFGGGEKEGREFGGRRVGGGYPYQHRPDIFSPPHPRRLQAAVTGTPRCPGCSMGQLQRCLARGEYGQLQECPLFESDFLQVTKSGDVASRVTLGIAATSPCLELPDLLLLARPVLAPVGGPAAAAAPRGCPRGGRSSSSLAGMSRGVVPGPQSGERLPKARASTVE
ncbi:unnamed protein product, partial [Natator depressus]